MTAAANQMEPVTDVKEIQALYVQTAHGMSYDNGKLTLHTIAPTTMFFSDRPDRVTGHISSEEFVATWDVGEDSFASNPPNAALSIFHEDGVSDIVVELMNPEMVDGDLTYSVGILDGEMPASGGPNTLFIDIIGRPLSPVSVCGVRRREDRRDRR